MTYSGPDAARDLNNAGAAKRIAGDAASAIECFRNAIALDPGYADALYNLGCALASERRFDEALEPLERASELEADNESARLALGHVLCVLGRMALELGRFDDAIRAFERAVALDPKSVAYRALAVGATNVLPENPHVAALEHAAGRESLSAGERIELHFALGKAYRDLGDHARAFDHVVRANAIKRHLIAYDEAATLQTIHSMPALFTPEFFERRRGWGDPSAVPVFVVGMPRSGTTLVEQILASHPLVHAAGETQALHESVARLGPNGVFGAAEIAGADARAMRSIGAEYANRLPERPPNTARVTDKMPENFVLLGIALVALPNARIVHVRRDPVDTCLSCFSTLFARGQAFTYDLGELGRYYRAYDTLMNHWHAVLPAKTILEVGYEDVVDDLEGQARRILEFCDLPWNDACLRFYETQRPVRTASVAQVRRPIYRTSVGKWRPSAGALQPLIDALAGQ